MKTPIQRLTIRSKLLLILLFPLVLLVNQQVTCQNKVHQGTTLKIFPNTSLISLGTLELKTGGSISNSGTAILKANFDNQNTSATALGDGAFIFSGTTGQEVYGINSFGTFTVNNSNGVTLHGNTTINNTLNLLTGKVFLGGSNLLLGASAAVGGTANYAMMVVATGTGEMRKSFNAPGSFTFPVGDDDGMPDYSPVTLNFVAGTFGSGNYAGVNLVNAPYSVAPPGYLNRYWNLTQNGITDFICHTMYHYLPADVVGDENLLYCARVLPEPANFYDRTDITWHQLSANWLNSFGTFTGQEPPNVSLPPLNQAENEAVSIDIVPNPFSEKTEIRIKTVCSGRIRVEICDISGQSICNLFEGFVNAGVEKTILYKYNLPSQEVLICKVQSVCGTVTSKMISIK